MFDVLLRKARTLLRDPELAIKGKFAAGDHARANAYLEREGVQAYLQRGRGDEIAPHPVDLARLHALVRKKKPLAVMEFGIGFSTIVFAHALMLNQRETGAEGHLWSVDSSQEWIDNTQEKLPDDLRPFITLCFSTVSIAEFEGELCHLYDELPNVVPDVLLVDGPSPADVGGDIRGLAFATADGEGVRSPMSADVLFLESTLPDGFVMHVDGRYANMHFLRRHLKRRYRFSWNRVHRFSTFRLVR
ncbi:MAG: hypothetical protein AAF563_13950 [Pseudomonadota bacterium]